MRFKLIPDPPDDLETVERAQRAVPLVPDTEADCCARLLDRLDLPSRDVARTWLTFLRALYLVEETGSGFRRCRVDPTPGHLTSAFRDRVLGVAEVLAVLETADGPVSVDEAFDAHRASVPTWEHHKHPHTWEERWRDRTRRLLDWLVLLGLAERADGGYRSV